MNEHSKFDLGRTGIKPPGHRVADKTQHRDAKQEIFSYIAPAVRLRVSAASFSKILCGLVVYGLVFAILPLSANVAVQASPTVNDVVTYEVINFGETQRDVPVTFGAIFARGDVPRGATVAAVDGDGNTIPLQLDRKASHSDQSLRHGIVTLVFPHLARRATIPITLRRMVGHDASGLAIAPADLPPEFDTTVTLTTKNQKLTVSARALVAAGKVETWLTGPYVSEWWVAGPLRDLHGSADPHLHVLFGIRSYGTGRPLRIEANIENDWTWVPDPRTEFYDVDIRAGARVVFQKAGMIQPSHTRWRKGFWWSNPVSVYVKQNLDYLKKARVIPNYEPGLSVSDGALAHMYARFLASDRQPMAPGMLDAYMPTTGGRPDIAPLPQWQAFYLLTMDPRAYQMTLETADLGASFSSHYRNEKTGRPATLEDYPNISTNSNNVGWLGQLPLPDTGGYKDPLVPDTAHEPALDFIPYLITGDRFYLEELQFWSQWNATGAAPEYHGFSQGLVVWDQVRAQAWSLRTLAQAEYITPDNDPIKPVLQRELKANVAWYNVHFSSDPQANNLGLLYSRKAAGGYDNGQAIAPWQDDFFTWSVGYLNGLGDIDALTLLRWKAKFPIGRMIAPGFCWILAPSYAMNVRDGSVGDFYPTFRQVYQATLAAKLLAVSDAHNLACAGSEMASALRLHEAGEMVNNARGADGYSSNLQAALASAVDSGQAGAREAWILFASRSIKPDYSIEPGWDIVPWSTP